MTEVSQNSSTPMQASERVFKALKEARSQLEAIEQARNERIAIVGMAGRFPGADNLTEFWHLLEEGKPGIRQLSDEELLAAGVSQSTFQQPNYVRAYASFPDPTGFDAQFFGYSPREAELIDPQQRVFLDCAWSALEDAGYDSQQYGGTIGVYGGAALNSYIVNLHANPGIRDSVSPVQAVVSNVMGLMPTRVSYKLDLKGPSCGIQTGCSTALVAIHTACQSLLNHECDMALAGGVTVSSAMPEGYVYQAESIASPDGVCRAFDAEGQGTVFGNGVCIVVFKRLQAALREGDHIYAVIAGSAVNNDGADKVNLIAPSVSGQAAVIRSAIEQAGVNPHSISYVEGHGTGTPLGDPIEVAALNKAFKEKESNKITHPGCRLGSVKTNLGHLDAAAGAAGVIKTVLSLQHKKIPASLNYSQPNPKIDFHSGPFTVNQHCIDWAQAQSVGDANGHANSDFPRRAGVSSFGMGGTNAHVILEEAPERCPSAEAPSWQLIVLSAKTPTALGTATQHLAEHLQQRPELNLADVAYTLQIGRRAWPYRRYCLCQTIAGAVEQLTDVDNTDPYDHESDAQPLNSHPKSVVFMFTGQGAQHIDMAKGLYETEPLFKQTIDQCAEIMAAAGVDLLSLLYPTAQAQETKRPGRIHQTAYAQPALFAVEYALAQLWLSWGIQPRAMIGHSIGEYVAACVAGVFSLSEAIALIIKRGQLMQRAAPGSMLSVLMAAEELQPLLPAVAEIAVINTPSNCVVSGPTAAIEAVTQQLKEREIPCRLLATSHAFHSAMMAGILDEFALALEKVTLSAPDYEIVSNVSGTWLKDSEATDPGYWVQQLRATVQFSRGMTTVLALPNPVLLEIGPGHTLTKLAQQHLDKRSGNRKQTTDSDKPIHIPVIQSLPHPRDARSDTHQLINAVGQLWLSGVAISWRDFHHTAGRPAKRHRLPLPTYPFERKPYWIPLLSEENSHKQESVSQTRPQAKAADMADWFYLPTWKRLPIPIQSLPTSGGRWLVFANTTLKAQLKAYLSTVESSPAITWVTPDSTFSASADSYSLQPNSPTDYNQLAESLADNKLWPDQIVYGWGLEKNKDAKKNKTAQPIDDFQCLLYLTQALLDNKQPLTISVLTAEIYDVVSTDSLNPEKAKALGFSQVIAQEMAGISCRLMDVGIPTEAIEPSFLKGIYQELASPYRYSQRQVAYRARQRWVKTHEPLPLPEKAPALLKRNSTYLIAGDFVEGLGMVYARALTKTLNARLILLGRPGLPAPEDWEKWLLTHGPDHGTSLLIRKLQALGSVSEQFLWFSGSLADADWVAQSVQAGIEKFGEISGVFHAGAMGDRASCPIAELTDQECDRITRSKIKGMQTLQQVLAHHPVGFYLLQSSLASVVGGIGFGAYAAANSYLDTLAAQKSRTAARWFSLNWDACNLTEETTESFSTASSTASSGGPSELMALAMSADEVWQATKRALAQTGFSQLIVSPRALEPRLEEAFTPLSIDLDTSVDSASGQLAAGHGRPALATDYVAPQTRVEQAVAKEMGDLLGIEKVGINDNFFELGGHSLLAIQAVTKLRKAFPVDLPMRAFLFEAPTVAGIAKIIQDQIDDSSELENLDTENLDTENLDLAHSPGTQATLESLLDQIEEMAPKEVKNEI